MGRFKWYLKQLLPLNYDSNYKEGNKKIHVIWKMWMGKCYNIKSEEV